MNFVYKQRKSFLVDVSTDIMNWRCFFRTDSIFRQSKSFHNFHIRLNKNYDKIIRIYNKRLSFNKINKRYIVDYITAILIIKIFLILMQ